MVGWHHQLNGHESEQAPGDGEGQEAWCAAVHGVTNTTKQLNNKGLGSSGTEETGSFYDSHFLQPLGESQGLGDHRYVIRAQAGRSGVCGENCVPLSLEFDKCLEDE